jgi:hypothetical protein
VIVLEEIEEDDEGEGEGEGEREETIQWRQYAKCGESGVGASGSTRRRVYFVSGGTSACGCWL